jgi:hypothetical protein
LDTRKYHHGRGELATGGNAQSVDQTGTLALIQFVIHAVIYNC